MEDNSNIVKRLTSVVREADRSFGIIGGSSRHYVRDCLLPIMMEHGLRVMVEDSPSSEPLTERMVSEVVIRERFKSIIEGEGLTIPRIAIKIAVDSLFQDVQPAPFGRTGKGEDYERESVVRERSDRET